MYNLDLLVKDDSMRDAESAEGKQKAVQNIGDESKNHNLLAKGKMKEQVVELYYCHVLLAC